MLAKNQQVRAMILVRHMQREPVRLSQCLLDGAHRFCRRIVGFAQVGQYHVAQSAVFDFTQQVPGFLVGQVAVAAFDALFQRPWVGAIVEHDRVVVGLHYQEGAVGEVLFHEPGRHTQIGCDADFMVVLANCESCWIPGIMGGGKWMDMQCINCKGLANMKMAHIRDPTQLSGGRRGGALSEIDWQLVTTRHDPHPSDMVIVFMRHNNRVQTLNIQPRARHAPFDFNSGQPRIHQYGGLPVTDEYCVAFASRSQNANR